MAFSVPNWAQARIAEAVGLNVDSVVVIIDNDTVVGFMHLKSRDRVLVNKLDGKLVFDKEERVVRSDRKRERPAAGDEGFL